MYRSKARGTFELAGIVSFGKKCPNETSTKSSKDYESIYEGYDAMEDSLVSSAEHVGAYTSVPDYVDWIKKNSDYKLSTISKLKLVPSAQ